MSAGFELPTLVALGLGGMCVVLGGVLAFRPEGGAGSGSLELPGIKLQGRGTAVLFLLVGAALVISVLMLRRKNGELEVKKEEVRASEQLLQESEQQLKEEQDRTRSAGEYIAALKEQVGNLQAYSEEVEKVARANSVESLEVLKPSRDRAFEESKLPAGLEPFWLLKRQ
jgi:hypothetical protein